MGTFRRIIADFTKGMRLLLLVVTILTVIAMAEGKKSGKRFTYSGLKKQEYTCALCHEVVAAIHDKLEEVHPTSTVMYGSRTVDGGGYEALRYARSEARIYEILEELCSARFKGANALETREDGSYGFVNPNSGGSFSNIQMGVLGTDAPLHACYALIEKYEDSLVDYLHDSYDIELDTANKLCVEWSRAC